MISRTAVVLLAATAIGSWCVYAACTPSSQPSSVTNDEIYGCGCSYTEYTKTPLLTSLPHWPHAKLALLRPVDAIRQVSITQSSMSGFSRIQSLSTGAKVYARASESSTWGVTITQPNTSI